MDSESKPKRNPIAKLAVQGYVSLSGFARIVRISYPLALRLRDEGKVRAIPVGKQWRVYEDEVNRYLREGNYRGESHDQSISPA